MPPIRQSNPLKRQRSTRKHYIQEGRVSCEHECAGRICVNGVGSLEWKREGNAINRHQRSKAKHPHCTVACPKHYELSLLPRKAASSYETSESTSTTLTLQPQPKEQGRTYVPICSCLSDFLFLIRHPMSESDIQCPGGFGPDPPQERASDRMPTNRLAH